MQIVWTVTIIKPQVHPQAYCWNIVLFVFKLRGMFVLPRLFFNPQPLWLSFISQWKKIALWLRMPINMLLIHRALGMHVMYAGLCICLSSSMFKHMEIKQNTTWQQDFHVCILMHVIVPIAEWQHVWELALKCNVYLHHVFWHMFPHSVVSC